MNPQESQGQQPDPRQGMPTPPVQSPDQQQPVAYDQQGRPLYLHPPQNVQQSAPQMVYLARPQDPKEVPISPEVMQRHEESKKKYPTLNLSKGEYVISAVRRHPIGLLRIWFIVAIIAIAFGAMAFTFLGGSGGGSLLANAEELPALVLGSLGVLYVLLILGGMAATYVYESNRFFLTNESVIQEIQTSLFDRHEQTVSLSNIEDASYKQNSFIQTMFNYGTIRLSTEGDETTYIFEYVAQPKSHIAVLNNAVEAFKNGRPVDRMD